MAVRFIRSDLEFILAQIRIAERQAAGENLLDILPNVEVPFGRGEALLVRAHARWARY